MYFVLLNFVKRKPVKTEKNTGTIALRFRQVLLYYDRNHHRKVRFVVGAESLVFSLESQILLDLFQ